MVTPNVWGQGQLFAFSALDGRSLWGDDFVGTLSGDKVGIRFHTNVKRELAIVNLRGMEPVFDTVVSDVILLNTNQGQISLAYADTHTVIGNVAMTRLDQLQLYDFRRTGGKRLSGIGPYDPNQNRGIRQ